MGTIDDIVTPKKNYILRMWLTAGAIAAALFLFMLWHDRFKADCETDEVFYGLLGVEQYGAARKSFSGSNFFIRAQKMGLGGNAVAEVRTKIEELCGEGAIVPVEGTAASVPVLWLYAHGLSKEIRDIGVRSRGEYFFDSKKLCISVVDQNGFSVQANPGTFTVFHAETGDAICAIPLSERPPRTAPGKERFGIKIEFREDGKMWKTLGEFPIEYAVPAVNPEKKDKVAAVPASKKSNAKIQEELDQVLAIAPAIAEIRSLQVPNKCRFYSSVLAEHEAYGQLVAVVKSDPASNVPDGAWQIENLKLSSGSETFGYAGRDAFHTNVRFLQDEIFENRDGNEIRMPIAKTLFPKLVSQKNASWDVSVRFIRTHSFAEEELHTFDTLKISKSPTRLEFAGTRVAVRAFMDNDYFRLLATGVPALVFEISGDPAGEIFWQPFRVKTNKGDDLNAESVVIVRPGVYQYWFMPTAVPSSVDVIYAITRVFEASAKIVPEIRGNDTAASVKIP